MLNPIRRILVPVDFSPVSDRVLRCVERLPVADGAIITLLHVVSRDLRPADRSAALNEAAMTLADMGKALKSTAKNVDVRTAWIVDTPANGIAKLAKSSRAELIVLGRCATKRGEMFLGSTAERVIRRSQLPVLVVRRGNGRYRRPAIAMDPDGDSDAAIGVMLRMLQEQLAPVNVIRALELPYHNLYYSSLSKSEISHHEEHYAAEEAERLDDVIAAGLRKAGAPPHAANRWKYFLPTGSPRLAIPRVVRKIKVDLLALGTRGRTGLLYAYLGSVAGDLLRSVECDVLVVPRRVGSSK